MKKLMLLIPFLCLIAAAAFADTAGNTTCAGGKEMMRQHEDMRGADEKEGTDDIAEGLGLSAEQKNEIKAIKNEEHKKVEDIRKASPEDFEGMINEIDRDNPDTVKLNAMIDKISDIHKQMLKAKVESMLKMKKVFTKDQIIKLKEKIRIRIKERETREKKTQARLPFSQGHIFNMELM
jgi:Spy/CpxP family protein refolding chaperone